MRFYNYDEGHEYMALIYADNRFEAANIYRNEIDESKPLPLGNLDFTMPDIDEVYKMIATAEVGAGDEDETPDEYLMNIIKSGKAQVALMDMRLLEGMQ